ncbi:MAG: hypothetical protein AAF211_04225 [Myxococcota bacterium]
MNEADRRRLDILAETQPGLAEIFVRDWHTGAAAWSRKQWTAPDDASFEPAFRDALVEELVEQGQDGDDLVRRVEQVGAVLTSHHVCPTPGPTFGGIDCLAALGQPGPVLVMAWSGVPMSNSASSGSLCFSQTPFEALLVEGPERTRQMKAARDRARDGVGEQRITLVPGALRDALLYQCPIPERLHEVWASGSPALVRHLPAPTTDETYASWALRSGEAIGRTLTGRSDLHYVDLNRVARRYLVDVLTDVDHPLRRLLVLEPAALGLDGPTWFYTRREGKRERVQSWTQCPEALVEGLSSGAVCPGLVPVFGALRTWSRMRLLGGFRQVHYLEDIAAAFDRVGLATDARGVPGHLVTARLHDGVDPVYPLDIVMDSALRSVLPEAETPMSDLWSPLLARIGAAATS